MNERFTMDGHQPRIAVITPFFPIKSAPFRGHSAYQTLRRMTGFAEIRVFCPVATYPSLPGLRPRSYLYRKPDLEWSPPGLQASYLEYPAFPLIGRLWNGSVCLRAIAGPVRDFRPDLILNYWIYPEGYAAVRLARRLGVPSIVRTIGSDVKRIPDPVTRFWVRRTLHRADFVLAASEDLRRSVEGLGVPAVRTRAILNGCDTSVFHPQDRNEARRALNVSPETRLIVYAGSIIATKGLRELVSAAAMVRTRLPSLQVALIGEGLIAAELRRQAAQSGLEGAALFPGPLPSAEVARWMAAADVFCLPSYSEGCPNVVLEALACGRPVVATDVGGIPELVRPDCGRLIPRQEIESLAEALTTALTTSWDETRIASRYSKSWEKVAEETWEVCRSLLPRR